MRILFLSLLLLLLWTSAQFVVDLLRVPALQMSYEWQRRSDCRQSYETALHFAFNILHLYIQEQAELEAAAAAAEGAVLQATRDTVMLMAEDALKSIADKSVRPGRQLEALVERLTRCPPLLDQVIRLGEVWLRQEHPVLRKFSI